MKKSSHPAPRTPPTTWHHMFRFTFTRLPNDNGYPGYSITQRDQKGRGGTRHRTGTPQAGGSALAKGPKESTANGNEHTTQPTSGKGNNECSNIIQEPLRAASDRKGRTKPGSNPRATDVTFVRSGWCFDGRGCGSAGTGRSRPVWGIKARTDTGRPESPWIIHRRVACHCRGRCPRATDASVSHSRQWLKKTGWNWLAE